ncbi:MAG: hypothetical protein A2287_10415 [Candidatus Melainabacteria bacterium RIFOXYA12_FULL_32_12]|nr:MAG: hypothetical protein A2255_05510 [Candidatus Melainabacteria bacterium RIFOXYA2_FULL_32_9]OGI29194.1 MAG: hypothetical protein A2287_10415 [Candidatus Melainabacteria bacterium RIFOXYA12_FULL_32_12]
MTWQWFKLKVITCIIVASTFIITGCGTTSIVNTGNLQKNVSGDEPENNSSYEMVKLSNGLIIYRDRSVSRNSSTKSQSSSSSFNFGPREVGFDPDPVAFSNR